MKLGRYDKYLGHMPYRLPILFVCAECGGGISVCCTDDGGYNVICMADERHEGLKAEALAEQIIEQTSRADAAESETQLKALSKLSPEVNKFLNERRKTLKKELFGED